MDFSFDQRTTELAERARAFVELQVIPAEPVHEQQLHERLAESVPEQTRSSIVHGDYRIDNTMLDADDPKIVRAVLDWEMAHVGDAMEDLAWVMDPLWGHQMPGLVAGTCSAEAALAAWEQASGRRFSPEGWGWCYVDEIEVDLPDQTPQRGPIPRYV